VTRVAPRPIGLLAAFVLVVTVLIAARLHRSDDTPFVPANDGEVLEHLAAGTGGDPAADELRALEAALARAPGDLALACRVARAHIDSARATGDARRLSYAEAALAPFWNEATPPAPALLLRATIRQARHEFDAALADLDRLVAIEPANPQAWLTRAAVLTVRARFDEARASCQHLQGLARPLVEAACTMPIDAITGHDAEARARLSGLGADPSLSRSERAWVRSLLGEAEMYGGHLAEAEDALRGALADEPGEAYTRGLLADVLLDEGRSAKVLALIAADETNEVLLLRRAIAARRTNAPDADPLAAQLAARDAALRARGDGTHRREEARRLLEVEHDPVGALTAARLNFAAQQEPWDVRVLFDSADAVARAFPDRAAEAAAAARPALDWVLRKKYHWSALRVPAVLRGDD
jgi:hypothetical protein